MQGIIEEAAGLLDNLNGITPVHARYYDLCSNYHKVSHTIILGKCLIVVITFVVDNWMLLRREGSNHSLMFQNRLVNFLSG